MVVTRSGTRLPLALHSHYSRSSSHHLASMQCIYYFPVRLLIVRNAADHCRFRAVSSDASFSLSSSFIATMTYAIRTMLAMNAAVAPAQVELPMQSARDPCSKRRTSKITPKYRI